MMAGCLTPGDVIQIIVAVVTAGGIICAFLMNRKQLGIYNKQLKQSFFAEYTRRYQEIILNFPENINDDGFDYDALESGTKDKVLRYMRVYFDLCSEEYHLHCDGSLEWDVWLTW